MRESRQPGIQRVFFGSCLKVGIPCPPCPVGCKTLKSNLETKTPAPALRPGARGSVRVRLHNAQLGGCLCQQGIFDIIEVACVDHCHSSPSLFDAVLLPFPPLFEAFSMSLARALCRPSSVIPVMMATLDINSTQGPEHGCSATRGPHFQMPRAPHGKGPT